MFSHPFMTHALLSGTFIAAASGLIGYFVVLRSQVFSGDALSHAAFTGALAALAAGLDAQLGLYVATIGVGLLIGALGRRGRADDIVVGSVLAWILGLGVFFLTIYTTSRSTANGTAGVTILFGSIFGLSATTAWLSASVAGLICVAVLSIARPLLFSSVDENVAGAHGVPVRVLGIGFLGLVGATAALATQAVGALLLLGLLAAPAGAAQRLTAKPFRAMGLSALMAAVEINVGLLLSYGFSNIPPSFSILAVSSCVYAVVYAVTALRERRFRGIKGDFTSPSSALRESDLA